MQVLELKHLTNEQVIELELNEFDASQIKLDSHIEIKQSEDEFFIIQGGLFAAVNNKNVLLTFGHIEHFIWLPVSIHTNKLLVQIIPCLPSLIELDDIDFAFDEKIILDVAKKTKNKTISDKAVSDWLIDEFVVSKDFQSYIIFATSHNKKKGDFHTIVGRSHLLQVEVTNDNLMWVKGIKPNQRKKGFELSILKANIQFSESTVASKITDPLIREKLEELEQNNSAYIKIWNEYNQKVKDKAIEEAKSAGFLRYMKFRTEHTVDGVRSRFYYKDKDQEKADALCALFMEDKQQQIEINGNLPDWLDNASDYEIQLSSEGKNKGIKASFVQKNNQYIELAIQQKGFIAEKGFLYLSISGSIVQMNRREKARDAITKLSNPMKNLRLLIEDIDLSQTRRNTYKNIKANTAVARRSFKDRPTEKQMEALDVALNTPDIALILGPPGTGKTQVISAIQNRLAEEFQGELTGQILLSSFQNDAVDNVVSRSEAFGIPAIRADDQRRSPILLEQWIQKQSAYLETKLENFSGENSCYKVLKNVRKDIATLLDSRIEPNLRKARVKSLKEDLETLTLHHGFAIPTEINIEIEEVFDNECEDISSQKNKSLLSKVRGLRTTLASYDDDGFEQLISCINSLKLADESAFKDELKVLDQAINIFEMNIDELLKLSKVKNALLDKLISDYRPMSLRAGLTGKEITLLHKINDLLTENAENSSAGIPDVIDEYLDVIKYQSQNLSKSVSHYTTSVGASCQRSQSEQVSNYKQGVVSSLTEVGNELVFDTVIVDEAARANPLDLFIPMSLAKRRIILVGDHFQLPQMLEPDIEKQMIETGDLRNETADAIKKSLFERLYKQLLARQAKDGIQRTVMLDTQFRMHPKLGQFVSRSFYESEGEQKILSGLPADSFNLGISEYKDTVAQWVDVPNSLGKESRSGTSWKREVEAIKVASEVQKLLDTGADISIGVITFFASQRELILNKLAKNNICNKSSDGWEYAPGFKTTTTGDEKIRVGSVDAFQGKEFDVVILSMVRSNTLTCSDENSLRKKYGFIRTPNRLNVAFSRGKSLIKVVGDKAMFSNDSALKAIPQVWSFVNELCEEK